MSNPAAWTFWLKERQVTGVIVAEHRGEKLVEYGKRFYVVKGKDPGKRHYTQSTIPAMWKKVMSGQLQVEEEVKELGVTKKEVKAARTNRAAVRGKAKGVVPAQEPPTATTPAKAAPAAAAPQPPAPKKTRSRKEKPVETAKAAAEPPVAPKQPAKRKSSPPPAVPPDPGSLIWLECPYCKDIELVSAFDQEVGKAHIRTCRKCKREFGARFVPVAFRVEVAPFPGK
ncbi:hypothetical protein [Geomonas subterranea]|uniref:hypothetical protein n=1 Tax=Geomonas subterranea TaxID=2847989 RepID=UPI001CD4A778|nr:hypothetical protein [Geomonas fuzhouensis]